MGDRLVIRGAPHPHESLAGYILRLASANGLSGPRSLLSRAGMKDGFDWQPCELGPLAYMAATESARLEAMAFWPLAKTPNSLSYDGEPIQSPLLIFGAERVCPECLDESGYVPRLWQLKAYAACHKHGRLLVDLCESCGRKIPWDRQSLHHCLCGAPLARGEPAHARVVEIAAMLAGASEGMRRDPFRAAPITSISTVVWYFGASAHQPDPRRRGRVYMGKPPIKEAALIIEKGAPFATDWRASFEQWASQRFSRTEVKIGLHRDHGPELNRIRAAFGEVCPFVIDDLRSFLSKDWQGFLLRRESYFCTEPRVARFIPASKAARILGINISRVVSFVRSGVIEALERTSASRSYTALRADSVEQLRRHLASLLTHQDAAMVLGISEGQVRKLRRAGYLFSEIIINHAHRFNPAHLRSFCEGLSSDSANFSDDLVRLSQVKRLRFLDVIKRVRNGHILAYYDPNGIVSLENVYVRKDDIECMRAVNHWHETIGASVSAGQALKVLRIGYPTLKALVEQRLIEGASEPSGMLRAIDRTSLLALRAICTNAFEVASQHGLAPAAVTRRLKDLGYTPLLSGQPARKIAAVWRLKDVEGVDFKTQWVTGCGRLAKLATDGQGISLPNRRAGRPIAKNCRSLGDVGRELVIDPETLRHLALAGFMEPGGFARNGHLLGVTRESVTRFATQYVSSSDIGIRHGLRGSSVTRRILSLGVSPILSPSDHQRVALCWLREDLAGMDFFTQWMTPCGLPSPPAKSQHARLLPRRPKGSPRLGAGSVYVHVATARLGTNSSSLRAVVDLGMIRSGSTSVTGKVLTVSERDVDEFDALYAFTPKIAAEMGLSATGITKQLRRLGAAPVMRGTRPVHTLWSRSDVEAIDLLQRWELSSADASQVGQHLL
jgi:hypothetical protein